MKYLRYILIICILINGIYWTGKGSTDLQTAEEIPVVLRIKKVGSIEFLLLKQNEVLYYPIEQIFNFFKIKIEIDKTKKHISGFYTDKDNTYEIDYSDKLNIIYKSSLYKLKSENIIIKENNIYVSADIYKDVFGLDLIYNEKRLSVELKSRTEIPALTVIRIKKNREKLLETKNVYAEPYTEEYSYKFFNGSTLDWRLTANTFDRRSPSYKYALGSGSRIFGSDLQLTLKGTVYKPIKNRDVYGFYRIPFLENQYIGQITLGDLTSQSLNSLGRVRGVEVTNRPARRRLIQSEKDLTFKVEELQDLEIYQAGSLINYFTAPSNNQYNVKINLPYGVSDYEFKVLDQWGGANWYRHRYYIPNNMLPEGELQYSIKTGYLRFQKQKEYGNLILEYGATDLVTLGSELQYLNSDSKTKFFPAAMAIVRLSRGITGEFTYSPFIRSLSKINFFFPSELSIMLSHEFFDKYSPLNFSKINNQATFNLRLPLLTSLYPKRYGLYYDMTSIYSTSDNLDYYSLMSQLSFYAGAFQYSMISMYNLNVLNYPQKSETYNWSTTAYASTRIPLDIALQLSTNYNHSHQRIESFGISVSKGLRNFYFIASYEKLFYSHFTIANLRLSYTLPFMRANSSINRIQGNMSYSQTFNGSILTSRNLKNYYFDNRQKLGQGLINFKPFYDSNGNLLKDTDENYIQDIKISMPSTQARGTHKKLKEGFLVSNPIPYHNYTVFLPQQQLENPNWVAKYQAVSTIAEPNSYKIVNIPFVDGGIISGTVYVAIGDLKVPIGGITIVIEELLEDKTLPVYKNKTYALSTGQYDLMNVPPGKFRISLLDSELEAAGYISVINEHIVEIVSQKDGYFLENIDFALVKIE